MILRRKKKVESTSFLSVIQTIDSTCIGWTPKRRAQIKDTKKLLESLNINQKTNMLLKI
jgi:hypothetical protein